MVANKDAWSVILLAAFCSVGALFFVMTNSNQKLCFWAGELQVWFFWRLLGSGAAGAAPDALLEAAEASENLVCYPSAMPAVQV